MARVVVPTETLERGEFPPVCCKTGEPAERYVRWQFRDTPRWTWVLLPFGVLPFLIASAFTERRFDGVLPTSRWANDRARLARRMCWLFGLASIALIAIGTIQGVVSAFAIGAAFGVLWLVCIGLSFAWSPNARPRGQGVQLLNVHRDFVTAVDAARVHPRHPAP